MTVCQYGVDIFRNPSEDENKSPSSGSSKYHQNIADMSQTIQTCSLDEYDEGKKTLNASTIKYGELVILG